ncbi:hypothetical protein OHV08_33920 [Streptomyces canus]|uniref:hypothetical protein n=1 Tax=Streptomyces canus TaxID=58343 RepID=UPI0032534CC4
MTRPSSAPRGERPGRPGANWETELASTSEQYVPECTASIRGFCLAEAQSETACDTEAGECIYAAPAPSFTSAANRATRRATQRRKR